MFKEEETQYCPMCEEWAEKYNKLKADNEKMEKGYIELTEIVSPYIDDFTGYNEELKGFDIVLCVKELMQQFDALEAENGKIDATNERLVREKYDLHQDILKLKQALQEIKEIANMCLCEDDMSKMILEKCEVIDG